jgi:tRNA-Thr(GGU) m(6)t(6)A37 methyltransferase TsaA
MDIAQIGIIKTAFCNKSEMPIQPCGGIGYEAQIIINDEFVDGLKDLEGFSHIYLIYYFHQTEKSKLKVIPFNDKTNSERGVFSTRTPVHPNKIGLSLVKLIKIHKNVITYSGVDILNGTPLLDIKPYIPQFDVVFGEVTTGWMKSSFYEIEQKRSDDRFN